MTYSPKIATNPGSRPPVVHSTRFRRGLLFFSLVFSLLLLADLGIVGNLLFRDLSRQVTEDAREEARQALESLSRDLQPVQRGEFYLVQTRALFRRYVGHSLQKATVVLRVDLVDAEGRHLASRTRRAEMERPRSLEFPDGDAGENEPLEPTDELPPATGLPLLDPSGLPGPDLNTAGAGTGNFDRVSRSQRVQRVTFPVQLAPGRMGMLSASIDPATLDDRIEAERRGLVAKVVIGAGFSVLLIVVAYIFVLKLFQKTRRLESDAQMADRLAYVGTLAAGLAHEIRNPLSAMKLNLQLLEAGLDGHSAAGGETDAIGWPGPGAMRPGSDNQNPGTVSQGDDEVREVLAETCAEVDRLGRLVTSFLSYARPPRLDRKVTDLNKLCEGIVHFMTADAAARGVSMELVADTQLPQLLLDSTQVRQALLNIVTNAVAAVESAGVGTVRLITSRAGSGEVRLTVEDDGRGIAPDKMPHIFEVFYSGRAGGSGLGLPIARRVVESHAGRIEVDSAPGAGTRFVLVFPVPGGRSGVKAAL